MEWRRQILNDAFLSLDPAVAKADTLGFFFNPPNYATLGFLSLANQSLLGSRWEVGGYRAKVRD